MTFHDRRILVTAAPRAEAIAADIESEPVREPATTAGFSGQARGDG